MKLKKFDTTNSIHSKVSTPRISISSNAASSINAVVAEMIGVQAGDKIAIFQDEDEPDNWFLAKDEMDGFILRKSTDDKMKQLLFNCSTPARKMIESTNLDLKRIRCKVGTTSQKSGKVILWPILTASAIENERSKNED